MNQLICLTPCLQEDARGDHQGTEVRLKSKERRKGGVERGVEDSLAGAFESKRQTKIKKKGQHKVSSNKTHVRRTNQVSKVKD